MGSRRDVQPYLALGKGLHAAGHTVRLLASENYSSFVQGHGLDFWGLPGDVQAKRRFAPTVRQHLAVYPGRQVGVLALNGCNVV